MERRAITYKPEDYSKTKTLLGFRDCVEKFTIFSLIGDPKGLRVLDAGCGDGTYARELVDRGAAHVLGIDCTRDFVELAREKSKSYGGKIEYRQMFVQDCIGSGDRDLVLGSFLLNYATGLADAFQYCLAIASHLKPSGRFVGFNNNPFEVFVGERYAKYGFQKIMTGGQEGERVIWRAEGMTDLVVNYYLNPETYKQAFRDAGLELKWERVLLDPSEQYNPHWAEFFEGEPPFIAMVAAKKE